MSKERKEHFCKPADLPLKGLEGTSIIHKCEICKKHIYMEEATNSSITVRKLFKEESPYLWDIWISDFCSDCVKKFKTKEDFINYIKEKRNAKEKEN